MRLCLFTDTLNDINGVSRFIRNVGHQAALAGLEMHLVTSTRFEPPASFSKSEPYIHNPRPRYARAMPGYPQLEIVVPPRRALLSLAKRLRPDVIHVSTPGPVGMVGRAAAKALGVPMLGTYHTDFPAYIDHLFGDATFTLMTSGAMRRFYRPFARLFTRSADYGEALVRMGFPRGHIIRLRPGIDTDAFSTRFAAGEEGARRAFWSAYPGAAPRGDGGRVIVRAIFVGRVSVEKNLPLVTRIWPRVREIALARGFDARLLVVGDGPYRATMEHALASHGGVFLGFKHGEELSRLYANSDLFLFPSTTDTLGQVVMEAQCTGLPVVVTDQGGPSEVVDDGATGLVLPVGGHASEQRWVREVADLIADPARRKAMGASAAKKIEPMSIRASFEHFWAEHERVVLGLNPAEATA